KRAERSSQLRCGNVRVTRPVTILTTDSKCCEGRLLKTAVSLQNRLRLATVARDASGKNRTVETVVAEFVARRESPALDLRVNGEGSFEKVVVTLNNGPAAIDSRTNHPFQFLRYDYLFRSEEHTSELQSRENLVCRLLLEKKKRKTTEDSIK